MLRKIKQETMGRSELGWLNSWFHFSFAEYDDPNNIQFGALRVVNDDLIQPHTGFEMHPHENMEIITYVIQGELTHKDSMGHERTLKRGDIQYMSAGTGVWHSEKNKGEEELRLLQIWIFPDKEGYTPTYGDLSYYWQNRVNRWLPIASNDARRTDIVLHQDMNVFVSYLEEKRPLDFAIKKGRQGYLIVIEGSATVNGIALSEKDAIKIMEEPLHIESGDNAHLIFFEMQQG